MPKQGDKDDTEDDDGVVHGEVRKVGDGGGRGYVPRGRREGRGRERRRLGKDIERAAGEEEGETGRGKEIGRSTAWDQASEETGGEGWWGLWFALRSWKTV